ncbi:DMT family transporter [Aliidiomarina haloalkalitolerans]|uniref:EamA family transporter n=1 Tax=Aliidiomarina haloalkalitolerans TaxID=859059 RepID=A0A432VRY9_9GAMM|nr:DMT family transporter [Aliidiomarina haloalkalitolerans]MCL4410069.1 DMT family transporter [Gammaproteobacteria bacterium]MCL5051116.1 DMT family transporter [Bacillota bacterium]RUO19119.1 EamA family transporter [Aliidiomarina haloalkalitolerans]
MAAERRAFLLALAAVLLWSTVATAFKITLTYLSPLQMVAAASAVSFMFLLIVILVQQRQHEIIPELRKHFRYYLILGLLNPLVYYLVLFQAYTLLPASQAQPLNYTWAIALTLMAALFLGQKIRKRDWIACVLGYLGVLVIATRGDILGLNFTSAAGVGWALLSTFLWAGYWILNTRHSSEPVLTLLVCFGISLPFSIGASWYFSDWSGIPWQGWAAVTYVGLFEMGLTFVLWLKAMKLTQNTAKISNLIFISPFISLVLLAVIIGETIYPATVIGLILIVSGLVIQQWRRRTRVAGEG